MLRALQPLGRADDSDKVPHELTDFTPALGNDNFFIAIRHAAFIPRADRRRWRQAIPMGIDMARTCVTEDETFEQRIGRKAVGTMKSALRHFASRI